MERPPSEEDGRRALREHAVDRARAARAKYGGSIDAPTILRMLDDREVVRYPVGIRYDAEGLEPGEFAHAAALGEHPREGFCLFLHPALESSPDLLVLAVAYHIPPVNYGDIAAPADCEAFGAALLGLEVEEYYQRLCALSDALV